MKSQIKNYISSHKHILFILYGPLYLVWFLALEAWTDRDFTIVHCKLDDLIPLVPAFIVPYYIWFAFVAFFCIYFYLKMPVSDAVKLYAALEISMTVVLIIYTVWPNALALRPAEVQTENIFSESVADLYEIDTDTNVCPSLHVLNTLTILVAYFASGKFKGKHLLNLGMVTISLLICASTVFLKQHSLIDVAAAAALCVVCTLLVYVPDWRKIFSSRKSGSSEKKGVQFEELQP